MQRFMTACIDCPDLIRTDARLGERRLARALGRSKALDPDRRPRPDGRAAKRSRGRPGARSPRRVEPCPRSWIKTTALAAAAAERRRWSRRRALPFDFATAHDVLAWRRPPRHRRGVVHGASNCWRPAPSTRRGPLTTSRRTTIPPHLPVLEHAGFQQRPRAVVDDP